LAKKHWTKRSRETGEFGSEESREIQVGSPGKERQMGFQVNSRWYSPKPIEAAVGDEHDKLSAWHRLRLLTGEEYVKRIAAKRDAEKRRLLKQSRRTIGADKIAVCNEYLLIFGSHERTGAMCKLISHEPAEIFWPVFIWNWPHCDATWKWRTQLVETLQRVGPCSQEYYRKYGGDRGEFFDSLPDQTIVYRGAPRSRIHGAVSWTTDKAIAQGFAQGHRGIAVPNPVVAVGVIEKVRVFLATIAANMKFSAYRATS
jgi:hypothetical protein